MFRVVYEWRVPIEKMDEFQDAWRSATESIHHSVEGALGSFMLRSYDKPEKVLTIAKWQTRENWERFWENRNPEKCRRCVKLLNVSPLKHSTKLKIELNSVSDTSRRGVSGVNGWINRMY